MKNIYNKFIDYVFQVIFYHFGILCDILCNVFI